MTIKIFKHIGTACLLLCLACHIQPCSAQIAPPDADSTFPIAAAAVTISPSAADITVTIAATQPAALEFDNGSIEKLMDELPASPKKDGKNLGLLEIEEQIAADLFEKNPVLPQRSVLLQVYEKMAFILCFPPLKTIVNKGSFQTDSACDEVLQKIEKIHSNNSILICSRHGLESVECSQSFAEQTIARASQADIQNYASINSKFDPVTEGTGKKRYQDLQQKLMQAHENYKTSRTIADLKLLESASYPVLTMLCRNQMINLSSQSAKSAPARSSDSLSGLADSIKSFEDSVIKSPVPQPKNSSIEDSKGNNSYFRARILTASCFDTIQDLMAVDSRLPSPICFKDSFIAPSCISSLRRFRTLKDEMAPGQPSPTPRAPKDGLSSF